MEAETDGDKLASDIRDICADYSHGAALYALCVVMAALLETAPRRLRLKIADSIADNMRDCLADTLSDRN